MVVRRQILRLSSHGFAFTFSSIRHFTPLRMTKCIAEYQWGDARKSLDIRFPVLDFPNIAHLTANNKDFSTSLEMTVRESH